MPIGMIFWMLMILWFIFGIWGTFKPAAAGDPFPHYPLVNHLFLWVLFFLIGWKVFGFVVTAS